MILDTVDAIIEKIDAANPERNSFNLEDRVVKMIEEIGELAEAFLDSTSLKKKKGKTWDDVQEEAVDVLIVAVDVALTDAPHTKEELIQEVKDHLHRITVGFYRNIIEISKMNALFAAYHRHEPPLAWQCAADMVRHAFAMNILVSRLPEGPEMSTHITQLVDKKLRKWQKSRVSSQA